MNVEQNMKQKQDQIVYLILVKKTKDHISVIDVEDYTIIHLKEKNTQMSIKNE